jgi:uncharacterized protein
MNEPWYKDGLSFECTRCGRCCTGEPGYVRINEEETAAIPAFLGISRAEFLGLYTQPFGPGRSLRERLNGDCVFFEAGRGCTIYDVRPQQCRTWPFWESNLRTPADWERTRGLCPGSGRGELIAVEEITRRVSLVRI